MIYIRSVVILWWFSILLRLPSVRFVEWSLFAIALVYTLVSYERNNPRSDNDRKRSINL